MIKLNRDFAVKKLNEKWLLEKKCECCGSTNWSTVDMVVAPCKIDNNIVRSESGLPQIAVVCVSCGNTKYFNVIVLGVMKNDGSFIIDDE